MDENFKLPTKHDMLQNIIHVFIASTSLNDLTNSKLLLQNPNKCKLGNSSFILPLVWIWLNRILYIHPYWGRGTSNGGFTIVSRSWPTFYWLQGRFDILNGIVQWIALPSCVVGHDISSTSLFIGMELSLLNRLWGKIGCHLFIIIPLPQETWFHFRWDCSTWTDQIFGIVGFLNAYLHFVRPM
jgi:hypothetical protein